MKVNKLATSVLEPPLDFVDPRRERGFRTDLWPLCNGSALSRKKAPDLHERRCLEFLAAFYRVNVLNESLDEARRARAAQGRVKNILQQLDDAMSALEELEDRYAPVGFHGEPVMRGNRYLDIRFVRPRKPSIYPPDCTFCSHFTVPGLEGIPPSELRGEQKIVRFSYGKVDL